MRSSMRTFFLLIPLFCLSGLSFGQTPGAIIDPANPVMGNPLDPNGDGYITSTGSAFNGPLDESEFELPYVSILQYQFDPGDDNQIYPPCSLFDMVNDAERNATSAYYYYQDPDGIPDNGDERMFFRFRLARFSEGVAGFSILMDTDYRFGFSGVEADPNALPGNPGFEREIAAFTSTGSNGGVRVFNIDGMDTASVINYAASIHTNYQMAYALNQDPACSVRIPVFVDMFVPFSALGISSTTQVRMVAAVNETPKTSLNGGASDIGGVDGSLIPDDDDQFTMAITHYSPIALGSANRAPLAADADLSIDENLNNGLVVYTVSGDDPDGDVLTYSITGGNVGSTFAVNSSSGEITIADSTGLDAEATLVFTLVVQVSDGKLFDNAVVTINLNDLNEGAPSVSDAVVSLDENTANGVVVHTVAGTDPDVKAVLTYSITGGNQGAPFVIHSSTGEIMVNNSALLDFETVTSFSLTVGISDGSFFDEATLIINLSDVNEPPSAEDAQVAIDENSPAGAVVHNIVATDPDAGATLDYSIISGNAGTAFAISTSGVISVNDGLLLDYEQGTIFTLVIKVSDGELYDNAIITVGLLDVNEPPSATDATVWVDEHTAEGTPVYNIQATDPDADTELEYTLITGNVNDVFYLEPTTGQLYVNRSSFLDFETTPVFTLSGIVSDGSLQDDFTIEVRLNDVNEPPSVTGGEFFLDENTPQGVMVGMVTGSDPDADSQLTYAITDGNTEDFFSINSTSGEILVNRSAAMDFETHPVFTLTVTVDDGALSAFSTVVIILNDLNEAPYLNDAVITVNNLLWTGDLLATIVGTDPDAGDVLSYTLESGNEELIFSFDILTGSLSVLDPLALFETHRTFPLIFSVTDRAGLKSTGTITIDVRRIPGRDDIRPSKGFSPNGDGTNDFWFISGIEAFPENVIRVFNRWGLTVFETRGYNNEGNAWRGEVKGTTPGVETTYFFVIHAGDFQPITGYLILKP